MDQEAIRPLRALVEEAATTVEQAELLARRLNCTSSIWQSLTPPLTDAPWRGLSAVRIVAYMARRAAVEVAEVAREAARVRHFASHLRCTVALRRCEPSLLAAAKTLRAPCSNAWTRALTAVNRDEALPEDVAMDVDEPFADGNDQVNPSESNVSVSTVDSSAAGPELWDSDWEAIVTAEAALSNTVAVALADGLKGCLGVDALCENISAARGEATALLAAHPCPPDNSRPADPTSTECPDAPPGHPYSAAALEEQVELAQGLARAAGAVGGCGRLLLREVQRGVALVHAALDGFGIPGEHGRTYTLRVGDHGGGCPPTGFTFRLMVSDIEEEPDNQAM